MRFLFALNSLGFLRHFDRVIVDLVERGHHFTFVVTDRSEEHRGFPESIEKLGGRRVEVVHAPVLRDERLREAVRLFRSARDYSRYHEPVFARTSALRARALERLMEVGSGGSRTFDPGWGSWHANLTAVEAERIGRFFDAFESLVPSVRVIERLIQMHKPDAVLVTPLVTFSSPLADWVKAAQALGLRVGFPVFSWDNLSTKGRMHVRPDRVFVWNHVQAREAIEWHGMDPSAVVETGAPRFDEFFEMRPSERRETLFARLGLDPAKPTITYLGSSPFVAPREREFFDTWMERVRSSPGAVGSANVLVRPHPRSLPDWAGWQPDRWPRVASFATPGLHSEQPLYDCLHHGDLAVALNTSAQLEAAILNKPLFTVLAPDHAPGQEGTLHFDYLLAASGGPVTVASDLDAHLAQLEAQLGRTPDPEGSRRFVERFLRPRGLDKPASPIVADAFEQLAAEPQARVAARRRWFGAIRPRGASEEETASGFDGGTTTFVTSQIRRERARADRLKEQVRHLKTELKVRRVAARTSRTPSGEPGGEHREVALDGDAQEPQRIRAGAARDRQSRTRANEPWTVAWIEETVVPGDVFFDIGARIGAFSLVAAARMKGEGVVVAFEPGGSNYAQLFENVLLNHQERVIVPIAVSLSASNGLQPPLHTPPVLVARLDDLIEHFRLPCPTHARLSVNGAILDVLAGAQKTFANPRLRTMMIEIDEAQWEPVVAALAQCGFEFAARHDDHKGGGRPPSAHGLFKRGDQA